MTQRNLYATIIGINAYPQNALRGCISDALGVDAFLRQICSQQEKSALTYNPCYFLAPSDLDKAQIEEHRQAFASDGLDYEMPTFDNIRSKAFHHFKQANPGDICVFFFSGHGSSIEAPQVFWHAKPDRRNETIVCVDSRSNPDARDLIDKEIAYLLHDALHDEKTGSQKEDVHCLVIMDCCHAGNNTRGTEDEISPSRYRHQPSSNLKVSLEQYMGFGSGFFQTKNNECHFAIARYVQLAASREDEKALEIGNSGLFTGKLLEHLQAGGSAKSYRELMQSLQVSIRNLADKQNPVAFAMEEADLDLQFLGKQLQPYKPGFEVRFDDKESGRWKLFGGKLHGLIPSDNQARTTVKIDGFDREIDVEQVENTFSYLRLGEADVQAMGLDETYQYYRARLIRLATVKLRLGFSQGILAHPSLHQAIMSAYIKEPPLYFRLTTDGEAAAPDYLIRCTVDDQYVLTRSGSTIPVFKREKEAASFLRNVDAVGKWIGASELKNSDSGFSMDDFIFTLERIEGKSLHFGNFNTITGESLSGKRNDGKVIPLPAEVTFSYVNKLRPAFRLSIALKSDSPHDICYIGALYLQSNFGIRNDLIRETGNKIEKNKGPLFLTLYEDNYTSKAIPFSFSEDYQKYGYHINEITALLKLFVSNKPIHSELEKYRQEGLNLDEQPNEITRAVKKRDDELSLFSTDNIGDKTDWTVFTTRFRIIGPNKVRTIQAGASSDFSAFTVDAPIGFEARAYAATGDDQIARLQKYNTRSADSDQNKLATLIAPPQTLWGGSVVIDPDPFAKGMNPNADNGVQVLELLPAQEDADFPSLAEGSEIVIRPKPNLSITRSINDYEEDCIVPYGYDGTSQLFFPIGYTDAEGNIHVLRLPPPSEGLLQPEGPQVRSMGGSIKLYFKKILRKANPNRLVLYSIDADSGEWTEKTDQPGQMGTFLAARPDGRALLLIHGITGDTKTMLASLKDQQLLAGSVDFVLTYDYENLSTPIEMISKALEKDLRSAGFGSSERTPGLTILAHSMGGLVSRAMIERLQEDSFVRHLILVGTPSGGSELPEMIAGVGGLLTHALNVTGPFKYALTGLSFLMKKLHIDPTKTMFELQSGSDFLQKMALSQPPFSRTAYSLIGADTSLLEHYEGSDFFLQKIARLLKSDVAYPALTNLVFKGKPNDVAVTHESMQHIAGIKDCQLHVTPGDHMSYFQEKASLNILLDLIKQ